MDCKHTNLEVRKLPWDGRLVRNLLRFPGTKQSRTVGFTLVELMVGVALGSLVLLGVASMYLFSFKSFTSMSHYSDLNARSRHASDTVTRDIRSAKGVISATGQQLVLRLGTNNLTYNYDEDARTLTRSYLEQDELLLEGVKSLSFSLYRTSSGSPYEEFSVATTTNAKLVGFQWECSRRVYGTQKSSQSLEAAIVKMRNK